MQPKAVLNFWFGDADNEVPDVERQKKWFKSDKQFDDQIKKQFTATLLASSRGELDAWELTPEGRLAFIILLDQFPRNIFRGTANAFLYDEKALSLARDGVEFKHDTKLSVYQRMFMYMPYQHSESMMVQLKSLKLFRSLQSLANTPAEKAFSENVYKHALQHAKIIKDFGRFPHRNEVLGRQSTAEEAAFLTKTGARFGQ